MREPLDPALVALCGLAVRELQLLGRRGVQTVHDVVDRILGDDAAAAAVAKFGREEARRRALRIWGLAIAANELRTRRLVALAISGGLARECGPPPEETRPARVPPRTGPDPECRQRDDGPSLVRDAGSDHSGNAFLRFDDDDARPHRSDDGGALRSRSGGARWPSSS
jgi:hypothetical protein